MIDSMVMTQAMEWISVVVKVVETKTNTPEADLFSPRQDWSLGIETFDPWLKIQDQVLQ